MLNANAVASRRDNQGKVRSKIIQSAPIQTLEHQTQDNNPGKNPSGTTAARLSSSWMIPKNERNLTKISPGPVSLTTMAEILQVAIP